MGFLKAYWQKLRPQQPVARNAAEIFWSEAVAAGGITTWLREPQVRKYTNELISGNPNQWPMDWFNERFCGNGFGHGLSVGCGDGALERDVLSKGFVAR